MKSYDASRVETKNMDVRIIRKHELAKKLGVSESTIYRWTKNGMLPQPLLSPSGRKQGWFTEMIEIWIEEQF
jgi:prophage regulatory protein